VDKVGNELFWCEGGAKLPSEAVISGNTDEPFFLLSLNQPMPNLYALPLAKSLKTTLKEVYCVYNQRIVDLCSKGNRTKEPSFFDKLLKKYNLKVDP
jgi:hypothetical protein